MSLSLAVLAGLGTLLVDRRCLRWCRQACSATALVLVSVAAPARDNIEVECDFLFRFGWMTCAGNRAMAWGADVGAVPHEMLDRSRFRPTEHYPHIWCDAPPLWNPWAQRSLVFKIDSGNVKLPVGDIAVWVAFDRPSAFKPYSASAAVSSSRHRITFDDHAGWKLARRALRRSDRLLWKFESDGQYFNSIGTLTLAGALAPVIRACKQ